MKRVVTVSLNQQNFNFDEDAYDVLRSYFKRAEAQLASDPGRVEVLADLERSIAEKCQTMLHERKNVITIEEMRNILAEVGVVDPPLDEPIGAGGGTYESAARQKSLVQIRDGAMVSGVCNGLAAHFGIDVTLLRVIFVVLAVLSSGAFLILYAALMFLIPYDSDVEKINDQSMPGFMFKLVTHTKRKLAGSS